MLSIAISLLGVIYIYISEITSLTRADKVTSRLFGAKPLPTQLSVFTNWTTPFQWWFPQNIRFHSNECITVRDVATIISQGPLLLMWINFHNEVWVKLLIHSQTFGIWEWISNFIPHFLRMWLLIHIRITCLMACHNWLRCNNTRLYLICCILILFRPEAIQEFPGGGARVLIYTIRRRFHKKFGK